MKVQAKNNGSGERINSFDTFKGKFIIIKLDEKPFHDQLFSFE